MSPQEKRKGTVVDHFLPTDVSSVKQESAVLKGCKIQFLNYGSHSKAEMEGLVARLGGTVRIAALLSHAATLCSTTCCLSVHTVSDRR